ncbi:RagB/SusD family nutrient uptake outer membrane protein [Rhizosphaericola mali]|uniref:RagB/SusD family nutrient uptake outer membrane protein n=1 Tax=Rhizosphaericola mali TaxID=2545455 RepID=A0A5P2G174_9BACT|nr:RagB/SusD family nutrient uptake outer membrane protein [Rhizosphaericola mali]QES87849.1 RagB/SusD family nutrient uptake outer membrane protein [Rhizosphaericola mali]
MKLFKLYIYIGLLIVTISSCNKTLEVTPKYILNTEKAFANDSMAALQMAGIYAQFTTGTTELTTGFNLDLGLVSDELMPAGYNATAGSSAFILYNYQLRSQDASTNTYWTDVYNFIYGANSIIINVAASSGMTDAYKKQCTGEALAWRAFFYYYLANFYGAVPYVTNGDYNQTRFLNRTSVDSIFQYCISDLKRADSLLSENYPTEGKFRFNKSAADALLARVYLSSSDYQGVIENVNKILATGDYSMSTLDNMFNADSKETILQIWSQINYTSIGNTANYDSYISYMATIGSTGNLYDDFSNDDNRKQRFLRQYDDTTYLVNKYQNNGFDLNTDITEYEIMFKLDELYLSRAEAYARLGQNSAALADVNMIRQRAGLEDLDASLSGDVLIDSILDERRKELCFEWSDRWITLKRTGKVNAVLSQFKPNVWQSYHQLFPIPLTEIQRSSITQNPGY